MITIEELKQGIIDALGEVDLAKLSLMDIGSYATTVKTVSEIVPKSYAEQLSEMVKNMSNSIGDRYAPVTLANLKKDGEK